MVLAMAFMYLITLTFLLVGNILKKHYSEFPDTTVGFHAGKLARKNRQTWEEANRYAGNYCTRSSLLLLAADALVMLGYLFRRAVFSELQWAIFVCVYILGSVALQLLFLFVLTSRRLKRRFHSDGSAKL
ncbi:MAG TPA: hypothetical protein DC013_10815 [Ruminococcaceae bacterium]|jgi:hypothetical protein|nr:hypothetical protein [Oscillospiraceae bacterium]